MKTRTYLASTLIAGLLLFLASPLQSQERHQQHMGQDSAQMQHQGMMRGMMGQQGMMGRQGMMGHGGMMGMMGMSPAMQMTRPGALLHLGETLGLSQDQRARLEEIQTDAQDSHQAHMQQAHTLRQEAQEMLQADSPDLDAYTETLQSAMTHMARAHASMMRASVEARDVLNDEQREQLESAARIMQGMHRMQGMEGMHRGMEMKKDEGGMPPGS